MARTCRHSGALLVVANNATGTNRLVCSRCKKTLRRWKAGQRGLVCSRCGEDMRGVA